MDELERPHKEYMHSWYTHQGRQIDRVVLCTQPCLNTIFDPQRYNSPIHLQSRVEGKQAQCETGCVCIQVVAVAHDGQQALAVIATEPVVKNSREAQLETSHVPCMEAIWGSCVWYKL